MKLIVVQGGVGVGKTTLAKKISEKFELPLIVKDEIKEVLFDTIGIEVKGWDTHEWQKKLGSGAIEIMHYLSDELLAKKTPHLIESNFVPKFANNRLAEVQKKYKFDILQIYCSCEKETLVKRIYNRAQSKDRHPGHTDLDHIEDIITSIENNKHSELEINGKTIQIDLTDYDTPLDDVYKTIERFLNN